MGPLEEIITGCIVYLLVLGSVFGLLVTCVAWWVFS